MASTKRRPRSRQPELFARPKKSTVTIDDDHRLVVATEEIDWTALEDVVQAIRMQKLKSAAGRPPHLRALIGAVIFRAMRHMTYRETEDQIRYYAPARYLCGLTETEWTPDANTIQDFEELMGEDGIRRINEQVVLWAVDEKLADPTLVVADTTAQEAKIPHPNEMGLLTTFLAAVTATSKHIGGTLARFVQGASHLFAKAKKKLRDYRLFAKDKSKEAKNKMVTEMVALVDRVQAGLTKALDQATASAARLRKYQKVAWEKLNAMNVTVTKLLPQIRHWLKTGYVAANKIISLHIPELYSVVRGKVGKTVEFGLSWGITRLKGGFLLAMMADKRDVADSAFAIHAVQDCIALFGNAPVSYAYDRGGYSKENIDELKRLGVTNVGLFPKGRANWQVRGRTKEQLISERAQVEGGIGTIKSGKYGFNKPNARSKNTMGAAGQRAVMGFNLTKLLNGILAKRQPARAGA